MPINGIALTSIATGSLLIWSGIKGWSLLATAGQVISGKAPSGTDVNPLSVPGGSNNLQGFTVSNLANDALTYQGHVYKYGGAPGKDGKSPWDCSSFINWVVGHDGHRAIPGINAGQYDGSSHGPPTGAWGVWPGLQHIKQSDLQPGDLIVWTGHMGMAVSSTMMVSALNSQKGTLQTPIAGYGNGPLLAYGRLI